MITFLSTIFICLGILFIGIFIGRTHGDRAGFLRGRIEGYEECRRVNNSIREIVQPRIVQGHICDTFEEWMVQNNQSPDDRFPRYNSMDMLAAYNWGTLTAIKHGHHKKDFIQYIQ